MTDRQIIDKAIELLKADLLPSALPAALMTEFDITVGRARKLAVFALAEWRSDK